MSGNNDKTIEKIAEALDVDTAQEFDWNTICTIGLDQLHYSNLIMLERETDWERFSQLDEVVPAAYSERSGFWACNRGYVSGFTIYDNKKFARLYVNEFRQAALQLTVSHIRGNNLCNLSWTDYNEYIQYLLTEYIPETYGLEIDGRGMKISSIEMNINLHLEYEYSAYKRAFLYLCGIAPIQRGQIDTRNMFSKDGTSIYNHNKSTELIFYNKIAQMQKSRRVSSDEQKMLRIEFQFSEHRKIQTIFKTNEWYQLNDELILRRFHETFQLYLADAFENSLKQSATRLRRMMKRYKRENGKNWIRIFIDVLRDEQDDLNIPPKNWVLDVEQILEVLTDKNGNTSRMRKNLLRHEQKNPNSRFLHGYIPKIRTLFAQEQEIFERMMAQLEEKKCDEVKNVELVNKMMTEQGCFTEIENDFPNVFHDEKSV